MFVLDRKLDIIAQIKALTSLNSINDNQQRFSNFQSVNNSENVIEFLIDLLKNLIGWDSIKEQTINFLVHQITPIEVSIKLLMKKLLRKYFFCNLDALVPDNLICNAQGTNGINIALNSIDFFHMFNIDPTSDTGLMLYGNPALDFNAFLYGVIQGTESNWNDIIMVEFHETGQLIDGVPTNNVFKVCVHPSYSNVTVNQLVDDFIDSIAILQLELLISRIFDGIFGTLNFFAENCFERVRAEEEFNILVEKLVDLPDELIDDSFFEFTNAEVSEIRTNITNRTKGVAYLKDCCLNTQQVNFSDLSKLIADLKTTSSEVEQRELLENQFTILIEDTLQNLNGSDSNYNILAFYENFFKGIIRGLLNILFSPKMIFMFAFYFKIVTGTVGFTNIRDFIRSHQVFFRDIIFNIVLPIFIKFLLKLVIKEIKKLIIREQAEKLREKAYLYRIQLESLIPVNVNTFAQLDDALV